MKNSVSTVLIFCLCLLYSGCADKAAVPAVEESLTTAPASASQVVGQARIEPEGKVANLAASVNGIVKNVFKQENDSVRSGDIIVALEHDVEQAKLSQSVSRLKVQMAKLKASESELEEYRVRVANKEKEFRRLQALLTKGSETQQRIDDAETELNVLKSTERKALANLEMARAELLELQQQRDLAQAELAQRFVRAPGSGRLISMNAVAGSALEPQTSFAEFAPDGRLIARAEVDELFANQVRVGQPVVVRLVGSGQTITSGTVVYAASSLKRKSLFSEKAGDQEDRRVREVKIRLEDTRSLLINSRVECVIQIDR